MDLGIKGRSAIVCGSSKGLGLACATALADAGVEVLLNGRSPEPLAAAAQRLSDRVGRPVASVAADVTTEDGRARLLEACPEPDILVTNAAGPPPGQFEDWGEAEWHAAVQANMVAPLQLIRATIPAMRRRGWGRILNITSSAVKSPVAMLGLSTGARSGLTGAVASLAREAAADGVTINNLLPGYFDTDRLAGVFAAQAARAGVPAADLRVRAEAANPTRRVGRPEEFGAVCAFLASQHAGFINGQNLLLDGGAFPGVF
ncbi:SDR family oxidoreductase [Phenylobacterium sp.]|uniref:SDR family oxidoreductase n=1 Tax=Phenylobacterium sp. TaxID=1871053 RepID=UPI002CB83185|nr:SDR family oxidoreductase [Phenylobacterium sp.]HLZ73771.1 SDR family oxidoreductase [Phenylobacterium sp.]